MPEHIIITYQVNVAAVLKEGVLECLVSKFPAERGHQLLGINMNQHHVSRVSFLAVDIFNYIETGLSPKGLGRGKEGSERSGVMPVCLVNMFPDHLQSGLPTASAGFFFALELSKRCLHLTVVMYACFHELEIFPFINAHAVG